MGRSGDVPDSRPKLALISYMFPPAGGVAVLRALSFVKYLPSHGIDVHVLAARNPSTPTWDHSLLEQIPPEVNVERAFTPELPFTFRKKLWTLIARKPSLKAAPEQEAKTAPKSSGGVKAMLSGILSPDPEIVWYPFALRKALRMIRRHGIQTVMVTAPPFSSFLIGAAIKRRMPHIRLISDFRDEWLRFYLTDFEHLEGTGTKAEALQRRVVASSDAVVAVTESTLAGIRDRYPDQPASKFRCIPNGYDPAAFDSFRARKHSDDKLVITYIGTAYKTSSPRGYLDALDRLPQEIVSRIETRFIGRVAETEAGVFENRRSSVRLLGFMPHGEAWRMGEETDFFLVIMANPYTLPAKLYEYLATGVPILALAPEGSEVDRMLLATRAGWCADPAKPQAVDRMLMQAWEWRASGRPPLDIDREKVAGYQRPKLAGQLAALLGELSAKPRS
jgi:glycosyltransferase involved in cell wall biosynthesis